MNIDTIRYFGIGTTKSEELIGEEILKLYNDEQFKTNWHAAVWRCLRTSEGVRMLYFNN